MEFTERTKLVLEKLGNRTRVGSYKWKAVGHTVRRVYKEWEIILSYGEDEATMTFDKQSCASSYKFDYVAVVDSKEYKEIQEIVDSEFEPINEILDELLVEEKRDDGTLTIMDRICYWWRRNK